MKVSEMIAILNDVMSLNGDMDVVLITDATVYNELDFNCPDADSPLYIEGYKN